MAHYCGAVCQKAGWRRHKVFCKYAQKEAKKRKAEAAAAISAAASKSKAKAAKLAAASGSGGAGVSSGRGRGQSGNRPHGGANDVGLGPASNGVVGSPFAHGELMWAAAEGDLKKAERLLASGADIEEVERGYTALGQAALSGHCMYVCIVCTCMGA